jgi:hypothetical protein
VDPTATEYVVSRVDDTFDAFGLIFKLLRGQIIEVSYSICAILQTFAISLGNSEFSTIVLDLILSHEPISHSNAVPRLRTKSEHHLNIDDEVNYVSKHSWEVEHLDLLSVDQLELILANPFLIVQTEDWLLNFILDQNDEYHTLIRYIPCQYLSSEGIKRYVKSITPNMIDSLLWSSICDRLCIIRPRHISPRLVIQSTPYVNEADTFKGIVSALTRECSGKPPNACLEGLIVIESSLPLGNANFKNSNLVDYSFTGEWYTANAPGSWVSFHFKTVGVKISSYSIRSFPGTSWPKNWVIEVRKDSTSEWVEIDRQENTSVLCGNGAIHHFDCKSSNQDWCQYVRMLQIGQTHAGNNFLCLSNMEFFGEFIKNPGN